MILKKPLTKDVLFWALVVLFLHKMALKFFLYWTTDWFDILMHFLGGFLITLLILWIFYTSGWFDFPKEHKLNVFLFVFCITMTIALGWELWEVFLGFTDVITDLGDTILDVIMDSLGFVFAFIYSRKKIWTVQI